MDNASLAAQAVANGPMSAAQPSFNGQGWLVVINLAVFTAAALVCAMAAGKMAIELWREGRQRGPLVILVRSLMLLIFGGMTVRTGVEALSLWGWDPHEPVQTGVYLFIKRLFDPLGGAAYLLAACAFRATDDAIIAKLEEPPYPMRLVASFHKLRRPIILAMLSLVAATLVVSLR